MKKVKVKSITVIGKLWFDKVNGNSYHTAKVLINGEHYCNIPFQYGYGDQYEQSALEQLTKDGYFKDMEKYQNGTSECFWRYCDRKGIKYFRTSSYVSTKRECLR